MRGRVALTTLLVLVLSGVFPGRLDRPSGMWESVHAGEEAIRGAVGDAPGNCGGAGFGKWIGRGIAELGSRRECLPQEVATDFRCSLLRTKKDVSIGKIMLRSSPAQLPSLVYLG